MINKIKEKEIAEQKQKIRVRLSGYDYQAVDAACGRVREIAERNGAKIVGPVPMPTVREVVTVIRSPHKDKDSREQFESRTHKRLVDIYNPDFIARIFIFAVNVFRPVVSRRSTEKRVFVNRNSVVIITWCNNNARFHFLIGFASTNV